MRVHELKTLPEYFQHVLFGNKTFEVRLNDRDYEVGDRVILKEWFDGNFTGREIKGEITYVLRDFSGLADGYCAFAFTVQ